MEDEQLGEPAARASAGMSSTVSETAGAKDLAVLRGAAAVDAPTRDPVWSLGDAAALTSRLQAASYAVLASAIRPFWTVVAIRVAFWWGAALSLLWSPLRQDIPPFRAYGPRSDLLFGTFAQWDSGWFLRIAEHGYDVKETSAFFPLYPLVVRAVSAAVGSTLVAGLLVSLVSAGVAAILLLKVAREVIGEDAAGDAVLYLALYPIAFVFTGVYADGLFLALALGSFVAAMRGRAWLAGVCGGLAVLTRLIGIALVPALLYLLWKRQSPRRAARWALPMLLLPCALEGYRLYLRHRFGDSLAFVHVLKAHWTRATPHWGPLGGLWEAIRAGSSGAATLVRDLPAASGSPGGLAQADQLATWNLVHLVLLGCVLWLTWVAWRRLGTAFGLYALVVALALLSTTVHSFPLQSFPRYVLADFPLFLALASVTATRPRLRQAVLIGFGAVSGVSAVAFAHHVWIA
jgi:Mannosyltransferase (PIG-V)